MTAAAKDQESDEDLPLAPNERLDLISERQNEKKTDRIDSSSGEEQRRS